MTPPYRLHYAPDNASLIVRLALEELALPYETALVDRSARGQRARAYLALNPCGLIPTLETPDGPIFETGAILLWLADRHRRLAPAPDAPERGDFLKHLFFTSNTLHTLLRMTIHPETYVGPESAAQRALRVHLQAPNPDHLTLPGALDLMDDYARGRGNAPLAAPTVLDYYLVTLLRWCALYPRGHTRWFDIRAYPGLQALAKALESRPAAQTAQQAEGLGPTPFSAPGYANPPEGSAT